MSLSNKQTNSTKQTQCTYQVHTGRMHEQIVFTKQVRQFKVRSTRVCVSIHLWWREEGKYSESLRQDLQINYLLHRNRIFGSTVRRESIKAFRRQVTATVQSQSENLIRLQLKRCQASRINVNFQPSVNSATLMKCLNTQRSFQIFQARSWP